ncbi:hypothetical protein [Salipiger sp.]|uniref:hypothetical protein n=1 Tax=Salipiger sp. TaxID=2078585 RepID=UPI003A96C226
MAKLPYSFDAEEFARDALDADPQKAWTKLKTVQEFLQDGEPVPPELARWLGEAITHAATLASEDANAAASDFTKRLGLTVGRGNESSQDKRWLIYGELMDRLCAETFVAAATAETREQMAKDGHRPVSDTQLTKWRDKYRAVKSAKTR